jgi:4-amino-4-deoxy-L-arabinose transferase-like glycosyltransferase
MSRGQFFLILILFFALTIRLIASFIVGDSVSKLPGTYDEVSYDALAQRWLHGYGMSYDRPWYPWVKAGEQTSYYSGAMVLYLAAIYRIFGYHPLTARVVNSFLGLFICFILFRLGRRLFSPAVGLVAAALASIYAYQILYNVALITEMPLIAGLLVALEAYFELLEKATVMRWLKLGFSLAIMMLFRSLTAIFMLIMLVCIFIQLRKKQPLWQMLIPILIIVFAVLPWTLRNYKLYGRFMLLESNYGHVFWVGNHPEHDIKWDNCSWVPPLPKDISEMNEADKTNTLLKRGIQNILADPKRFLLLTLHRTKRFFTFWPLRTSSLASSIARLLSFGILLPFMLYGLFLSFKNWRKFILLYLFIIIHTGIHAVSWVMIRYRAPVDALLILFAAAAIVNIYEHLRRKVIGNPI